MELQDARSIKERLPIAYVLDRYGIPVQVEGASVSAICPFHQDTDPSLDLFGERLERWGCYPCGAGGDVFDLLTRLAWPGQTPEFRDVRAYALVLVGELEASDWAGPRTGISRAFDASRVRVTVEMSAVRSQAAVLRFVEAKHARGEMLWVHPAVLRDVWRVGSRLDEIIIPYYCSCGDLVSYKHRTADTPAMAAPGSRFDTVLYGEWLDDDPSLPILLCEGESDAWAAHAVAADVYAVRAVPTGATARPTPDQLLRLEGRDVVLAFDGDEAGRRGLDIWYEALDLACEHVMVPDGTDLAGMQPEILRSLLIR